jgi:cyclopropane fatty-acyl-phospholipid synthase-like methyltransferase
MNLFKKLFFAIRYLGKPPWDTGISPPELMEYIQENKPGTALDLGCGTGTNAITLAENGWETTGVDFSTRAIRIARQKSEKAGVNIRFHTDDVSRLKSIDGKFEFILDIGCFHSLSKKEKNRYIMNLPGLLNDGGDYLVYGWYTDSADSGTGINKSDLKAFSSIMTQIFRKDSTEKGKFPSLWLLYKK